MAEEPRFGMVTFKPGDRLEFTYDNHRGETRKRKVELIGVDYGCNEFYPSPQWFLRCYDREREGVIRSFALAYIIGDIAQER